MKKHLILFFAGVILSYGNIKAQTVPDKKEILKVTLHVNDYFMKKYADYRTPSFVKKVVRPSNNGASTVGQPPVMQIITAPAKSISIYTTFAPILKKYGKRKPIWICWSILHK